MSDVFKDVPVELNLEVSEMVTEIGQVVRLDQSRVQELLDDYNDDKPQFPILRVEAGTVSGNGNHWPEAILDNVAEQINRDEKPGYWGHIPKEQKGYLFPDPETVWLGATVKNEGGKKVLYVKGYNHPESRARKHRRFAKVTSWAGVASGRFVSGVRNIESFALESIDWARPGSQGMSARVVAWATEMEEGSESEVEWSKITLADIERENPSLFALMRQKVEAEQQTTVQEMKDKADKADQADSIFSRLRKLLKIDESKDIVEAVTEAVSRVEEISKGELRDKVLSALTAKLGDKDETMSARKTIQRLFPIAEMVGKSDDEIKSAVDDFLSSDVEAKVIVTEMVQSPAPLSSRRRDNGKSKVGGSGMVSVGSTKL